MMNCLFEKKLFSFRSVDKKGFPVDIGGLALAAGGVDAEAGGGGVGLVEVLDALVEVVLDGGESRHDGRGAEAVGDHGEVSEVSLYTGIQDWLGSSVAQGGPVLVQQIHQLLADVSENKQKKRYYHVKKTQYCSKNWNIPKLLVVIH